MYSKAQLEQFSLIELKAVAKQMDIPKTARLNDQQELIYKILDFQAANPQNENIKDTDSPTIAPKKRGRPPKSTELKKETNQ